MMDKRLLALVPEAMRHVIATVLWQWVGLFGNVALVWVIARSLSALVMGQTVPVWMPVLLAVGIVARTIAARMGAHSSFAASQDVKRVLRRHIYQKLLALGPNYTEQVPTAEVVQLSVEGCEQLETYFGQYLPQLFYSVLAPVTLFAVVAPVSLPAAVVLLLCVPLIPATIVAVQKVAKRILGKYWDQYAELGDSFLENLQGLTTLKIYQADAARHEAMNREAEHFRAQDGLETRLTEGAANLSGGQRQRLALARAVLRNSPVYIFDEATSNVDVESEEAIMDAVRELSRTHAVVLISHRPSTMAIADKAYSMDRGRVS